MSARHIATTGLVVTAALTTPTAALSQPADGGTPSRGQTGTTMHGHRPMPRCCPITFTNPLGRSRGPGTGAGAL